MPKYNDLVTTYEKNYLPRWQRIKEEESIQVLKAKLARMEQGAKLQKRDIEQNELAIAKTNIPELEKDIITLQGIVERHTKICADLARRKKDFSVHSALIAKAEATILQKKDLIRKIKISSDGVLPEIKAAQEIMPQLRERLAQFEKMAIELQKGIESNEAKLKVFDTTRDTDIAYICFFQVALSKKLASTLNKTFFNGLSVALKR